MSAKQLIENIFCYLLFDCKGTEKFANVQTFGKKREFHDKFAPQ